MSKRIYLVNIAFDDKVQRPPRLVRASNQSQAIRHVAKGCITAKVASQDDLIKHLPGGVEVAGEEPVEETETEGEAA